MTASKKKLYVILIFLSLVYFVFPVLGIGASFGTNGVSSSENYKLDDTTSLQETQTLSDNAIYQNSHISGLGTNSYDQHTTGDGYIARNSVVSSGSFTASTMTVASKESALKSQDVSGSGYLGTSVSGTTDLTSSIQKAAVLNGNMATSQNVAADRSILVSGQSTAMTGVAGISASSSESPKNRVDAIGWFSGSGHVNTDLSSATADDARIYGRASMMGNDQSLSTIGSSDGLALATDGLYIDSKGNLGRYGLETSNVVKSSTSQAQSSTGYGLTGYRWTDNPQIHILLSGNTVPSYLNRNTVAQEISKGANQWDTNTKQNLFKGSDTAYTPSSQNAVEVSSYVPSWSNHVKTDGKNVHAWTTSLSSPTIAQTVTWYYTSQSVKGYKGNSYKRAIESDCWYNKNMQWRIASAESPAKNSKFDIRSIATHELGHTVGLADLYNSADSNEIMYGYNSGSVKWALRSGDKLGLLQLYGPK